MEEAEEDRYTRITLRIPKDLHRSLSEAAEQTSKSLNAEIIGRLTESFQGVEPGKATPTVDLGAFQSSLAQVAKQAHTQVLLLGLESQIKDAVHRIARQRKLVDRMRRRSEELEESGDIRVAKASWNELEGEKKWLAEVESEHETLLAEFERLRQVTQEQVQPSAESRTKRYVLVGNLGREVEPIEKPAPRSYGPERSRNARKPKP